MGEFLKLLPPSDALQKFLSHIPQRQIPSQKIKTEEAIGRICAESILSPEHSPSFPRSSVDGYAVIARDSYGASESAPLFFRVTGEILMGKAPNLEIHAGESALIHTGGMLPRGSDAVIMLEQAQATREGEIEVIKGVSPGENIIQAGEDIHLGDEILQKGRVIRPVEIGGLLAVGLMEVPVYRQPIIGILSSGDELVNPDTQPAAAQVRDINTSMLSHLIEANGGMAKRYPPMPDDPVRIKSEIQKAYGECDALVITAGSSASTRDFTAGIVQQMGDPGVLVHGVNIKPGKPTILAVCGEKPIIGLPGNPVSAFVIASLFVLPMMRKISGSTETSAFPRPQVKLKVNLSSVAGREDYWPVKLEKKEGIWFADPVFYKSNLILSLVRADALAVIPTDANGMAAGDWVEIIPLS